MPIRDLFEGRTPRPPVIGRIRLGVFEKNRPIGTDTLVFTARDEETLLPLQKELGGELEKYTPQHSTEEEWRLISESDSVDVLFPFPHADDNFSQDYELWSRSGIKRRCDGYTATVNSVDTETGEVATIERSCVCKAQGETECNTVTRLRFLLPQVPGLGVFELQTGSKWALFDLHDMIGFLATRFDGAMHRLPLRLTYGNKKIKFFDEKAGKQKTVNKRVPSINLTVAYLELEQRMMEGVRKALDEKAQRVGIGAGEVEEPVIPERATVQETPGVNERADVFEEPVIDERAKPVEEPVHDERADEVEGTRDSERADLGEEPAGPERAEDGVLDQSKAFRKNVELVAAEGEQKRAVNLALRLAHDEYGVNSLEAVPEDKREALLAKLVEKIWGEDGG